MWQGNAAAVTTEVTTALPAWEPDTCQPHWNATLATALHVGQASTLTTSASPPVINVTMATTVAYAACPMIILTQAPAIRQVANSVTVTPATGKTPPNPVAAVVVLGPVAPAAAAPRDHATPKRVKSAAVTVAIPAQKKISKIKLFKCCSTNFVLFELDLCTFKA